MKTKHLLTSMMLAACCAAAQDVSTLESCIGIKDGKKRLACFDVAAPVVVKQANEMKIEQAQVAAKNTAREGLQQILSDAFRELRKLATATSVGISYTDYGTRVADVAAAFQESAAKIADMEIKNKLNMAMTAYIDAMHIWDDCIRAEYIGTFFEKSPYAATAARYGVTINVYRDKNTTFRRGGGCGAMLSAPWQVAEESIKQAEMQKQRAGM